MVASMNNLYRAWANFVYTHRMLSPDELYFAALGFLAAFGDATMTDKERKELRVHLRDIGDIQLGDLATNMVERIK